MEKKNLAIKKSSIFYSMYIPNYVERKIRILCKKIYDTEWSGILFYSVEGSFENNDLNIICEDILPLNIGTTAYTEFTVSPEIANYIAENPDLINCQQGLVHSHNSMNSFFSGTDIATLKDEGEDRNHFVSLIVNNAGDYTAAITKKNSIKKIVTESYTYNTFNAMSATGVKSYEIEETELEYYNLNISIEDNENEKDLLDRVESLRATALKSTFPTKQDTTFSTSTTACTKSITQPSLFEDSIPIDTYKNWKSYYEDIPEEEDYYITSETVDTLVKQIVTGSIIIPNESKVDVEKWVNKMEVLYSNRFGDNEEGFNSFKDWAYSYIDYIVCSTPIPESKDTDLATSTLAYTLKESLSKYNKNKYLNYYIEILDEYII